MQRSQSNIINYEIFPRKEMCVNLIFPNTYEQSTKPMVPVPRIWSATSPNISISFADTAESETNIAKLNFTSIEHVNQYII